MSSTMLPRVEDLERSSQWTSLTSEIDGLERMCQRENRAGRRSRKSEVPEYFNYQRRSMPEVQKAASVWIKPSDGQEVGSPTGDRFPRETSPEPRESHRWSWRPKTEFERTYFFDEYSREAVYENSYARSSPVSYVDVQDRRAKESESVKYSRRQSSGSPLHVENCLGAQGRSFHKFGQRCGRCEFEERHGNESPYSGSRERLHEIFERNRYLRRKFFSDAPGQETRDAPRNGQLAADFAKSLGNKGSAAMTKYRVNGFGSTETLTSQSNQSSVSSTNERKYRGQSNNTPELLEEGKCIVDFPRSESSAELNRLTVTTDHGKLLVNVVPSNKVYIARKIEFGSDASASTQSLSQPANGRDGTRRFTSVDGQRQDFASTIDNNRESNREDRDARAWRCFSDISNLSGREATWERSASSYSVNRDYSQRFELGGYGSTGADVRSKFQSDDSPRSIGGKDGLAKSSVASRVKIRSPPRDFCKSLPNLVSLERKPASPILLKCSINDISADSNSPQRRKARLRPDSQGRAASGRQNRGSYGPMSPPVAVIAEEGADDSTPCIELSDRGKRPEDPPARKGKIPPPLDLTGINERYEELEASERKHLNNYTEDVTILRSHDCPVRELVTVEDDAARPPDGVPGDSETGRHGSGASTGELGSPRLVNNCKNATALGPPAPPRPAVPEEGNRKYVDPSSDRPSLIGGAQPGAGTTLASVYGPIPYSQ